jgi:hypothetical protein
VTSPQRNDRYRFGTKSTIRSEAIGQVVQQTVDIPAERVDLGPQRPDLGLDTRLAGLDAGRVGWWWGRRSGCLDRSTQQMGEPFFPLTGQTSHSTDHGFGSGGEAVEDTIDSAEILEVGVSVGPGLELGRRLGAS